MISNLSLSPFEIYLNHLDNIFQKEPLFYTNISKNEGLPGVVAIIYKDIPEDGYITGITYELSLIKHPEWEFGRPELCLTVESNEIVWGQIPAYIANYFRGNLRFSICDLIDFNEKISEDSEMNAFFIFTPSIFEEKEDYEDIEIGTDYKINLKGLYPIYSDELDVYRKIGFDRFWDNPDFELFNIKRKHVTI